MQSDWLFIGLFLLIVALFPGAPIILAGLIGPHRPSTPKSQTYECGIETVGETWVQFQGAVLYFCINIPRI